MMDKETFMHRKGEILHEARMNGNDTFDGLAGSIAYWQDVANYAHEKRVEAEQRIAQLEEEVKQARGMAEQNDQREYIGVLEDRIAQLEAALVEAEAGRLHLYKEMLRLDNPPDTDECPQCGGKVEGTYSTWYECWEADMNHDEDCPLEIAHNALGALVGVGWIVEP